MIQNKYITKYFFPQYDAKAKGKQTVPGYDAISSPVCKLVKEKSAENPKGEVNRPTQPWKRPASAAKNIPYPKQQHDTHAAEKQIKDCPHLLLHQLRHLRNLSLRVFFSLFFA